MPMAWFCKYRFSWYWWIFILVVAILLVKVVITNPTHSVPSSETPLYSVDRQGKKERSNFNDPFSSSDEGSISKLHSGKTVILNGIPPTAKKRLFHGRPYTTPPTPNVVLPDFQAVAQSPTKPPVRFFFPYPSKTKTPREIFTKPWVKELHKKLNNLPLRTLQQVSLVFADSGYTESLLNWLIAAKVRLKPPLENVLVICLDETVFNLLSSRSISALLVTNDTILKPDAHFRLPYTYVWLIRMVVFRIVNYFGFDVVSYDVDAVPLRNLQPVFKKYQDRDIIGSAGRFPFSLNRAWGFTMCMGVILFRSTRNTEMLWELMSTLTKENDTLADQTKLNYAFRECGIQWQSMAHPSSHIQTKSISGQCSMLPYQNAKITILPHSAICRDCKMKRKYYVVHPRSKKEGKLKIHKAEEYKSFFLARNWRTRGGELKGSYWLAALMKNQATNTLI